MKTSLSEALLFLRLWFANPLRVAAVTPSGTSLARLMTSEIGAATGGVIELGAGTGAFTKALLSRGIAERDLTLVEVGIDFANILCLKFPRAEVLRVDAAELHGHGRRHAEKAGAVISGLPLLSMPKPKVMAIMAGAFAQLRADGAFYQFTYGPRCPIAASVLDRLGLQATRIGRTLRNIPPAAVYRITRRDAAGTPRL